MDEAINLDKRYTEDAILEIAKGNVPGSSIVQLTGRNPHVALKYEDVCDIGGVYTIAYNTQVANFTVGTVVTGTVSGAKGNIIMDIDGGVTGTLYIRNLQGGNFQNNEQITDPSGGDALVNGTEVKERGRVDPTAGVQFEVVCENTEDDITRTGANTILVEFMEKTSGLYTAEPLDLSGHTPVPFSSADAYYFRRIVVSSWGGQTPHPVFGKTNLGVIIVRNAVTKDIQGMISMDDIDATDTFGINNTMGLYYKVPKGFTAYPTFITVNTVKGNDIIVKALAKGDGVEGYSTVGEIGVYQNSFIEYLNIGEAGVSELTDFKMVAKSDNLDTLVNVQAILVLVKDK